MASCDGMRCSPFQPASFKPPPKRLKNATAWEGGRPSESPAIISVGVLKAEGAVREGCAPVSIKIDTNDLILLSKRGRKSGEHLKGPKATVKHDQRLASSMNLVVKVDSVYRSVFSCWIVRIGCHEQLLLNYLAFCN